MDHYHHIPWGLRCLRTNLILLQIFVIEGAITRLCTLLFRLMSRDRPSPVVPNDRSCVYICIHEHIQLQKKEGYQKKNERIRNEVNHGFSLAARSTHVRVITHKSKSSSNSFSHSRVHNHSSIYYSSNLKQTNSSTATHQEWVLG